MSEGWELTVAQGAIAIAAGAHDLILRLPDGIDPLARLHGAQALVCEWALDRLDEAEPPGRVVVRSHEEGLEPLAAVVGVGLRQALAPDGAADRVVLAGGRGGRRRARAS